MSNKDAYPFWCSSCKQDHAGECAKPGEASGKAMTARQVLEEHVAKMAVPPRSLVGTLARLPQPGQGNGTLVIGIDTPGLCPEPNCPHCRTGRYAAPVIGPGTSSLYPEPNCHYCSTSGYIET